LWEDSRYLETISREEKRAGGEQRIDLNIVEETGNWKDMRGLIDVESGTSMEQSKKEEEDLAVNVDSRKSVGTIPVSIVECITYLGPRMFSELRCSGVMFPISVTDALLRRLSDMWREEEILLRRRISFSALLGRELNTNNESEVDHDDLQKYYNWVVYSGHHALTGQSDSSKVFDPPTGFRSSETGSLPRNTEVLPLPVEIGPERYCIELLHGLLNYDVQRTSVTTESWKVEAKCLRCRNEAKRRRSRGPGTRNLLLSLLQVVEVFFTE